MYICTQQGFCSQILEAKRFGNLNAKLRTRWVDRLLVLVELISGLRSSSELGSNAVKECNSVNTDQSSIGVL
jgi:hypothetical protein